MDFKGQLSKDLASVFMNTGEFAETAELLLAGLPAVTLPVLFDEVPIIADPDAELELVGHQPRAIVAAKDLPRPLAVGDRFQIRGLAFTVRNIQNDTLGTVTAWLHRGKV